MPVSPDPGRKSTAWSTGHCWRWKKRVVLDIEADLPARCVRCNTPTELAIDKRLVSQDSSPLLFLLALFAPLLLGLIATRLMSDTLVVRTPLCDEHLTRYRRWKPWSLVLLVSGVALIFVSAWLRDFWTLGVAVAVLLASAVAGTLYSSRPIRAVRLDPTETWIAGAGTSFLDSLPDYSGKRTARR